VTDTKYQIHPHVSIIRIIGPPACNHLYHGCCYTRSHSTDVNTATFGEFLSIAPNDHYACNYTALMQNFAINSAAVVATPATVRAQVVEATAQQKAVGLVALT